jgi:D-alanyl-D-alanine carboxypeptidase (penicillin-binding protein 5/6)
VVTLRARLLPIVVAAASALHVVSASAVAEQARDAVDPPLIGASAAAVIDGDSGAVLYGEHLHARRAQASLTKMTTALVAREHAELDHPVIGTEQSLTEPVVIGLEPGDELSLHDALYGMLLNSGNDAALAIAESVGEGSIEQFVAWMNDSAERMGLQDTHFVNPHGFDADKHYSSAYDLALIGRELLRDPFLAEVVSTSRYEVEGPPLWVFHNTNPLLGRTPGVDGIKTGYETNAGHCLVVSASRDGHRVIVVVLNDDAYADDSEALLNWAFATYVWRQVSVPPETLAESDAGGHPYTLASTTVALPAGQERYLRGMVRFERLARR